MSVVEISDDPEWDEVVPVALTHQTTNWAWYHRYQEPASYRGLKDGHWIAVDAEFAAKHVDDITLALRGFRRVLVPELKLQR